MSEDKQIEFEVTLDDGRVAKCWEADRQEYSDCVFSSGLVEGIDPDTIYLQLEREGVEPTTLFVRPDEAQALAWLLNGALWSQSMLELDEKEEAMEQC